MGIELKQKSGSVKLTAPKTSGVSVDLSNYYTKTQTDEKIQEAVANIDIPEVDLSNYATTEYVDNAVSNIEIPKVDLTGYALKTDIPSLDGYAKTEDIPDVSAFQTETQVNTLITNALSEIGIAEDGAY